MIKKQISSMCYYCTILVGEIFFILTTSVYNFKNGNFMWLLLLTPLIFLLLFLLPTLNHSLLKYKKNYQELLNYSFKGFSIIVKSFYFLVFAVFSSNVMLIYSRLVNEQINQNANPLILTAIVIAVSGFCSAKGAEGITRTSIIITAFSIVLLMFLFIGLVYRSDMQYVYNAFPKDAKNLPNSFMYCTLFSVPLATLPFFSCKMKGKVKLSTINFALIISIAFATVNFLVISILSNYSSTQKFPVFTLSKLSVVSIFRGGDGVFFSVATASVFMLLSLFFISANKAFTKSHSKICSLIFAIMVFVFYVLQYYNDLIFNFFYIKNNHFNFISNSNNNNSNNCLCVIKQKEKKVVKKIILIFLSLAISICFSSCSTTEIDKTAIVDRIFVIKNNKDTKYIFKTIEADSNYVQSEYAVSATSIFQAKKILEEKSVSLLYLGLVESIVFSNNISENELKENLNFFNTNYETTPLTNVFFSENEVIEKLINEKIPANQLSQLANLEKDSNTHTKTEIYSLSNALKTQNIKEVYVITLNFTDSLFQNSRCYCELFSSNE